MMISFSLQLFIMLPRAMKSGILEITFEQYCGCGNRPKLAMNIFTYGSLMFPEVWQRVVRGDYRSAAATIADCRRYAIERETYPGMVRERGGAVTGVVYFDVDTADLAALDAFEGTDYRRETVDVRLATGETVPADTYFYLATARLLNAPWDPGVFQKQLFLNTYCRDRLAD
jgi:gamma-glutamylcyclotransferase (GGCT)/AIG2-like uncharacterized protein YtfP